jgi:hypothetical protein
MLTRGRANLRVAAMSELTGFSLLCFGGKSGCTELWGKAILRANVQEDARSSTSECCRVWA